MREDPANLSRCIAANGLQYRTRRMRITRKKRKRLVCGIAQLLRRTQRRRKEHADENASGYANNATVDRTRFLQNGDRAGSD